MKIYNRIKFFVLMVISLTIIPKSFGQLTGTYTIGGSDPDYSTINDAINDVAIKGVSGSVVFNIRSGTYSSFSIGAMSKLIYPDSIILQSETHDSTDVVISGKVRLTSASGITLRWLTIEERSTIGSIAVQFSKSYHCNILNCIINTPNSRGTVSSGESAFDIAHNWELPLSSIRIENCQLIGKGSGFFVYGTKGITQIINCHMSGSGRYSIVTNWVENLSIVDCYLKGSSDINDARSGPLFKGNVMVGDDVVVRGFNVIEGNEFIRLGGGFQPMSVEGNTIRSNRFRHNATLKVKTIELNIFDSGVDISNSDNVQFFNNTMSKDLRFLYCKNLHMFRNVIYGTTRLSFVDFARVDNNIFYDEVENAISSNNKFYYNNFVGNSVLYSEIANVEALYNNFNQGCVVTLGSNIKYNNYFPAVGFWDQHPYHYDPGYVSDSNARASNPLLMGKGESVGSVTHDIDGVSRPKKPTLGASEICISSFRELEIVTVVCGDGICLRRCDGDKLPGYRWYPSIGLSDTISATPIAKPLQNTIYYLADSTDAILDSVLVEVSGFKTEGIDSFYLESCGGSVMLGKNFNPSASYNWSPTDGLSNAKIFNPLATSKRAILYIQDIFIPGCGSLSDSVFLNINPLPIASGYGSSNKFLVTFFNYSSCSDRFLWYFGDGQQSTDLAPIHIYDSAGLYECSLIAFNQFGSDTVHFSVQVYPVGIRNTEMRLKEIELYPNPTSGLIHIELTKAAVSSILSIYNSVGQLIQQLEAVESIDYSLPEAQGVYIVQIVQADGSFYTVKVVKE